MSTSATRGEPLTALETVVLEDQAASSRVVVAPARGGIVTRFEAGGEPVLYLDMASLLDETKNVRGGIPVLFPSPGPLAGDAYARGGRSGRMKQHGFARLLGWPVVSQTPKEVVLELVANDATRALYPWEFTARLRYALEGTALTIETRITNTGDAPMPFALGFHPYFAVPDADKAVARIPTNATRAFDNVTKREVAVSGPIDLTQKEVDLHLIDHTSGDGERHATLERRSDSIDVSGDASFGRWVVWTLAGKDFVCLEPWTAPADALNTGHGLITLAPGEHQTLTVRVRRQPKTVGT